MPLVADSGVDVVNRDINSEIPSTQKTQFIIDASKSFSGLDKVDFSKHRRAIVFYDANLEDTWAKILIEHLRKHIQVPHTYKFTPNEDAKDIRIFTELIGNLHDAECSSVDLVVAIGGGCLLDPISFAASTYMRGVPILMIPTTLIGQCDASTAGKTCLNFGSTKNLVGTLHMPDYVYNNVRILDTLNEHHMRQGFSEIFKYGLLGSLSLLDRLQEYKDDPEDELMRLLLETTIYVRLDIRKTHPLASNLGHTFGHALETLSHFKLGHGDAISIGTAMALDFSVKSGFLTAHTQSEILCRMDNLGLYKVPSFEIDSSKMVDLMMLDKKSRGDTVGLVLISDIGVPLITQGKPFYPVGSTELEAFISEW